MAITVINSFTGEYEFLSNTYSAPIMYQGLSYLCVESAYWAQRVKDEKSRRKFASLKSNKARSKAINMEPVDDWDSTKEEIMKKLLQIKFSDPVLKKKLLATGDAQLLNNVSYNDPIYGIRFGKGKNLLGKFLEEIRASLKK